MGLSGNMMKIGFCIAAFVVGCLFAVLVRSNNQAAPTKDGAATTLTKFTANVDDVEEKAVAPPMVLNIVKYPFGTVDDSPVSRYVCANKNGVSFEVIDWGAAIVAIKTKDRNGRFDNVVLNCEGLEGYQACDAYFGSTLGRFSNRIANGKFSLDGQEYSLSLNDDNHHLHGGAQGFDKRVWTTEEIVDAESVGVRMSLTSQAGDQGFPGTCETSVTYLLNNEDQLSVEFQATTDSPTPINLANQIFWNLDGEATESIASHRLRINADKRLVLDDQKIPTGYEQPVDGTRFDFRQLNEVGHFDYTRSSSVSIDKPLTPTNTFKGYDEDYTLNSQTGALASAATLISPKSGRKVEVWTTQPGLHLDTANTFAGLPASGGLQKHSGISLRPQHHADSPNQPDFPSTILRPGETYTQTTVFSFSIAE